MHDRLRARDEALAQGTVRNRRRLKEVPQETQRNDYYTLQSDKLLRQFDKFLTRSRPLLAERYGEEVAAEMHREMLTEYERLIPQTPYIGGKKNPLTDNLVQSGWALALYRVVCRRGSTLEEAGELIHLAVQARIDRIPAFLRPWLGMLTFGKRYHRRMQEAARRSQARQYPGDWVWEVIEGDGKTFDLGMDFTECGIVKLLHAQGADELGPYLCNLDYVTMGGMGIGLRRTMTLAWGCKKCDFRLIKGGETPPAWPPRFVERRCGNAV
jgi:hypothetical protein